MAEQDSNHVIISRKEAKARGLKRYFTGKPCKHGHVCERYVGGHCVECDKGWCREWRSDNKEWVSNYFKELDQAEKRITSRREATNRRRKNSDVLRKHNALNAIWRDNNPQYLNEWRKKNPEKNRAISHKRRALKKSSGGTITAEQIKTIYNLQKGKCAYCKTLLGTKYQMDHIIPIAKGGRNEAKNIQLLCPKRKGGSCNQRKRDKDPIEFARSLGLLL